MFERKFSKFSTSNFTIYRKCSTFFQLKSDFFQLFKITKIWYFFIKLTPLKFNFNVKRNFENQAIFGFFYWKIYFDAYKLFLLFFQKNKNLNYFIIFTLTGPIYLSIYLSIWLSICLSVKDLIQLKTNTKKPDSP